MANEIQTIRFQDADSEKEATAIVRVVGDVIGLSTFVVDGGECEIYMSVDTCRQLQAALSSALESVRSD